MILRLGLVIVLFICGLSVQAQPSPIALLKPKGWSNETISFPIEFAPNIPYKAVEELRFAPGWSNPKSNEHWSYCFIWLIDEPSVINEQVLTAYMTEYYSGLVNRNIISRNIAASKVVPTVANINSVSTGIYTFGGEINMLNYMVQKPITLHIRIHQKKCTQDGKTALFFEVSPQPNTHKIWRTFEKIWSGFECD